MMQARGWFALSAALTVATLARSADAASTCRHLTDPAELAQWQIEGLSVERSQARGGPAVIFTTTGSSAKGTSPELNYTTLPDQIWLLCGVLSAAITQPDVIRRVLDHLGTPSEPVALTPVRGPPEEPLHLFE